jgi:hypothetical protein
MTIRWRERIVGVELGKMSSKLFWQGCLSSPLINCVCMQGSSVLRGLGELPLIGGR